MLAYPDIPETAIVLTHANAADDRELVVSVSPGYPFRDSHQKLAHACICSNAMMVTLHSLPRNNTALTLFVYIIPPIMGHVNPKAAENPLTSLARIPRVQFGVAKVQKHACSVGRCICTVIPHNAVH
jgi:hypothetical protein